VASVTTFSGDGTLLFIEHVRAAERRPAIIQDRVARLWRVAANCHPNRDSLRLLSQAGFDVRSTDAVEGVAEIMENRQPAFCAE
jgi:hypothetical protein